MRRRRSLKLDDTITPEFKLFQLVPQRSKDLVSRFIGDVQKTFNFHNNPYYIIPTNVIILTTIYYSAQLHKLKDNNYMKNDYSLEGTYDQRSNHSRMDGKITQKSFDISDIDRISFELSTCLNTFDPNTLESIIQPNNNNVYMTSDPDIDAQIIIKLVFKQGTHLTHIILRAMVPPPIDEELGMVCSEPKLVKLFINKPEINFDDIDLIKCAQQIVFDKKKLKGKKVLLKPKFKICYSLQIYIVNNQKETECTYLNRLTLICNK
eukprot:356912_1